MPFPARVIKVGGSLFDLPGLGERIEHYCNAAGRAPGPGGAILIPGGGPTADVIRMVDRCHGLGEERAHWLALQALSLNAHVLAELVPSGCVVADVGTCPAAWADGRIPILDPLRFAAQDEGKTGCLPHCWDVTSDSIAARVAVVVNASSLVLLKSTPLPPGMSWTEAGRAGLVDPCFAEVLRQPSGLREVEMVSFRAWDESDGGEGQAPLR